MLHVVLLVPASVVDTHERSQEAANPQVCSLDREVGSCQHTQVLHVCFIVLYRACHAPCTILRS
jgi:hypothetical protein